MHFGLIFQYFWLSGRQQNTYIRVIFTSRYIMNWLLHWDRVTSCDSVEPVVVHNRIYYRTCAHCAYFVVFHWGFVMVNIFISWMITSLLMIVPFTGEGALTTMCQNALRTKDYINTEKKKANRIKRCIFWGQISINRDIWDYMYIKVYIVGKIELMM